MTTINVAGQFSPVPAGRVKSDGPYSGEHFRERFLEPALRHDTGLIRIQLDGTRGYGSSFLEEAFGGLVRKGWSADYLIRNLAFESENQARILEIQGYIREAEGFLSQHDAVAL